METERLKLAAEIAQGAGKLLLAYYQSKNLQNRLKADFSLVTEADLAADNFISSSIQRHFPGERILSEETATAASLDAASGPNLWVIDPLDGTTNFFLGLPIWGVSIACLENGTPRIGVVYFPVVDELYTTQIHLGAFLNGKRISVETPDQEKPYSFFSCCSRTITQYNVTLPYKTRILGSAAYSLCCVAKGSAIIAFEATPKIWDLSAAWPLVQEASGVVDTLDGSQPFPVRPGIDYVQTSFPTIAAATNRLSVKAHQQITPR